MTDISEINRAISEITEIALGFGLDPFPIRYEICPPEIIYTLGAYGMPTRFSHWSFGKAFNRMKLQYNLGLGKIYELIINSNPSYAFLMDGNSLIQNKLIIAHVTAHSDFFKNNVHFAKTSRDMVESMARTAERIREYEHKYGKGNVEDFLDAVLSIQENIDPYKINKESKKEKSTNYRKLKTEYDDIWNIDKNFNNCNENITNDSLNLPEKDLLLYIEENSKVLDSWHKDIINTIREEMLYFWPQIETKIMNEGWASYWHTKILRELDLTTKEAIEFAKLNSAVVQPSKTHLNPYYLGNKIFEDIEQRYDNSKIFEVRETDSDISFIRNYLTKDLVDKLDIYLYHKKGNDWIIIEKEWEKVRDELVKNKINGGFPYIIVENGDYLSNGELYLKHLYEGIELDIKYLERTLPYVYKLWGRTVHLETIIENREVLFSYDGKKNLRKFL